MVQLNRSQPGDAEQGSISTEMAIIGIIVIVFIGSFLILVGRTTVATGAVDSAAHAAARAASLARTADAAQAAAQQAAESSLNDDNVPCTSHQVTVDTSGFAAGLGQAATATATVTCTVPLDDLAVPGVPGSKTIRSEFTSALDEYRVQG